MESGAGAPILFGASVPPGMTASGVSTINACISSAAKMLCV